MGPQQGHERGWQVLLVEDEPADQAIVRALLEQGEPAPTTLGAATVREAMEALGRQPIDIVVLDLGLPDAEGLEALTPLVSMQSAPPVVVLTGNEEEGLGEAAVSLGAEDFLPKSMLVTPGAGLLLDRALRYAVGRHRQHLALERESSQLRWLAARQERFLDQIANDLQGPITALYGIASTLSERDRSLRAAERRELVDKLLRNAQSLGRRLNHFVADAQPTPTSLQRRTKVAMADIVPAAINAVGERPAGTRVHLEGELPAVWGRAADLQQAISELVRNAVLHTPRGRPPQILVHVGPYGHGVRVTVADDGRHIPPGMRSTVFEPGVTLDARSTRPGLGLAEVRAIVADHGGAVWIEESELGGTKVTLTIPQRVSSRRDDETALTPAS